MVFAGTNMWFNPYAFAVAGVSYTTAGLVGYWDVSNVSSYSGSGTTMSDLSGKGQTLTFNATPGYVSSPPSISLTTTNFASSAALAFNNYYTNGLTIEVLFNENGNSASDGYTQIFSLAHANNTYAGSYRASIFGTPSIAYFGVNALQLGYTNAVGSQTVPATGWTHFVSTCTGWSGTPIVNTYLNAVNTNLNENENAQKSSFDTSDVGYYFYLGKCCTLNGFVGNVALVRVYNTVLTPAQISANYASIKANGNKYSLP